MNRVLAAALFVTASVGGALAADVTGPKNAELHASGEIISFVLAIAKPTAEARIRGNNQNFVKAVTLGRNANGEAVVTSFQVLRDDQQPEVADGTIAVVFTHHSGECQPPHGDEWRTLERKIVSLVIDSTGTKVWEIGYRRGVGSIRLATGPNRFGPPEEFSIDPSRYRTYACDKFK